MDDDILRIRAHEALVNELMTDDNYGNDGNKFSFEDWSVRTCETSVC